MKNKTSKYRKMLVTGVTLFAFVFVFSGAICQERAPETAPVTLTIWNLWDDTSDYSQIIEAFTDRYPHISIKYEKKELDPSNTGYQSGYEEDVINALAEGEGPDIFTYHNSWLPKFKGKLMQAPDPFFTGKVSPQMTLNNSPSAKELLVSLVDEKGNPLENGKKAVQYPEKYQSGIDYMYEALNTGFVDTIQEELQDSDGVWGVSLYVDSLAMYYNKDLLNSAGVPYPPKNWQDFQNAVRKVSKVENGSIVQAGAAIGSSQKISRSADVLALLMMQQCGRRSCMTDEYGQIVFDREVDLEGNSFSPGVQALDFYTEFGDVSKGLYTWSENIFSGENYESAVDAFAAGKVGMMFDYYDTNEQIYEKNANLNYGIAEMPQVNTNYKVNYSSYWALGVSKNSDIPLEAWAFLEFLTRDENAKIYKDATGVPTSKRRLLTEYDIDNPAKVFVDQSLTAKNWYQVDAPRIEYLFNQMIRDVVVNNMTTDDAVKNIARDIRELSSDD